eukprot:3533250-Rhodomonas_salina.1
MFADEQPRWRKQLVQHRVLPDGNNYQIKITVRPHPRIECKIRAIAVDLYRTNKVCCGTELAALRGTMVSANGTELAYGGQRSTATRY